MEILTSPICLAVFVYRAGVCYGGVGFLYFCGLLNRVWVFEYLYGVLYRKHVPGSRSHDSNII